MKKQNQIKTVTANRTVGMLKGSPTWIHWSPGVSSCLSIETGCRLSLSLWYSTNKWIHHPIYDGKWFASSEEAWQWMLEHGFIEEYRVGWCLEHRRQHYFIVGRSSCGTNWQYFDKRAPHVHRERAAQGKRVSQLIKTGLSQSQAIDQFYAECRTGIVTPA